MREIWFRLLQTSGAKVYSVLLGIISLTITARVLGPEGRGKVVAVTTWATAFATLGNLSLGQVALREASITPGDGWLRSALNILIANTVFVTIVSFVGIIIIYNFFSISIFGDLPFDLVMLGALLFPFMLWEYYGSHLLMGTNDISSYNYFQIFSRSIGLISLLVMLLVFNLGPASAVASNIVAYAFAAVFCIYFLQKKVGQISFPEINDVKRYTRSSFMLHVNTIGTFFFSSGDILMLNYFKGPKEIGLYQVGVQLISVMLIIPQSAAMIFYTQTSEKGANKAWKEQKQLMLYIILGMSLCCVMAGLSAFLWLPALMGESFADSIDIFKYQLLSVPLITFCTLMGPQWIARGLFIHSSVVALSIAIANLLLNRILIPIYGVYGAVAGSIFAYLLASLINCFMFKDWDRRRKLEEKNTFPE